MGIKTQEILVELKRSLQQVYGDRLVSLVLFGSQARQEALPDSDIDLLILLRGDVLPGEEIARTGKVTADLSLRHNVVISCIFASSERFQTEKSPLFLNIHREGISV